MSNVYSIINGQPIIQNETNDWQPNFAAMPSWITVDPDLNYKSTKLQQLGWIAVKTVGGMVFFAHERICPGECKDIHAAWNAQIMDELKRKYWGTK